MLQFIGKNTLFNLFAFYKLYFLLLCSPPTYDLYYNGSKFVIIEKTAYGKSGLAAKVRQREAVFGQIIQVFRTQEAGKLLVVTLAAALLDRTGTISVVNL